MFNDAVSNISLLLEEMGLSAYASRIWVLEDTYPVVDFAYRDLKFGVNFIPSGNNTFSIDVVRRKSSSSSVMPTFKGRGREHFAHNVSLRHGIELLKARVRSVVAKVDQAALPLPAIDSNALLAQLLQTPGPAKKIGILTLPFNVNIGGNLQGYALMQVLRQLGHQPILINRRGGAKESSEADRELDSRIPLIANTLSMSGHQTAHSSRDM